MERELNITADEKGEHGNTEGWYDSRAEWKKKSGCHSNDIQNTGSKMDAVVFVFTMDEQNEKI